LLLDPGRQLPADRALALLPLEAHRGVRGRALLDAIPTRLVGDDSDSSVQRALLGGARRRHRSIP
jgi:hypothetical protein